VSLETQLEELLEKLLEEMNKQLYEKIELTHESLIMSQKLDFLPMTPLSCVKNELKLPKNYQSIKEKRPKLYISKPTCKENCNFLYICSVHNSSFITYIS